VAPALGYLPVLGFVEIGPGPLWRVATSPGFAASFGMSVAVGVVSTALATALAILITAGLATSAASRWLARLAAPMIAVPHLAVAIGAAFLLAPSGWLMRLLAQPLGLSAPPALALGAAYDLAVLGAVLVLKETPFLVAVLLAVARQLDDSRAIALARSLGYGELEARLKLAAPRWLARSRLAVVAVLVYGVGNVELALVLGPSTPPLLQVLVLDLLSAPDLAGRLDGSAAALWLVAATGLAWLVHHLLDRMAGRIVDHWLTVGATPSLTAGLRRLADLSTLLLLAMLAGTLLVLALWSLAGPWRFTDILPAELGFGLWRARGMALLAHAGTTALIALVSAGVALGVVLLWLEASGRQRLPLWLWLPLVVPQLAFLYGLQILLLQLGLAPGIGPVIFAHLLFVIPYTALLLADSWAHQDPRLALLGRSLGHGSWSVFFRVKLPQMRAPLLLALAIGASVSVALYLPTLFGGGGRVATLATEAVALAQGGDRRLAAATGVVLALLPLAGLVAAQRAGR